MIRRQPGGPAFSSLHPPVPGKVQPGGSAEV